MIDKIKSLLKHMFCKHTVDFKFNCPYREYGKCRECGKYVQRYIGETKWRIYYVSN